MLDYLFYLFMSVELAKAKLQSALERIEEVIDHKIAFLELENNNLRAEIIKLKHEIKKFAANSAATSLENEKKAFSQIVMPAQSSAQSESETSSARKKAPISESTVLKAERPSNQNSEDLLAKNVANEIDISLSKLKKLVG